MSLDLKLCLVMLSIQKFKVDSSEIILAIKAILNKILNPRGINSKYIPFRNMHLV
jgi:hypothetical protein